ncbi:MAG: tetratricopeptide repeat protein, partial [Reyranella sp.]
TALSRLGARGTGTAHLEEAVSSFGLALQELTRERAPLQWAEAQMNLGNALARLGEREAQTARLEEAVSSFRLALQEWTRERVPLQWAQTQMSLGVALSALGERETGTAHLVEAVAAWDLSLTVGDSGWPQERAGVVRSVRDQAQAEIARRLSK